VKVRRQRRGWMGLRVAYRKRRHVASRLWRKLHRYQGAGYRQTPSAITNYKLRISGRQRTL